MIDAAWFRMNWHQVSRFGPGRRFGELIRRILDAEISMPSFLSPPGCAGSPRVGSLSSIARRAAEFPEGSSGSGSPDEVGSISDGRVPDAIGAGCPA